MIAQEIEKIVFAGLIFGGIVFFVPHALASQGLALVSAAAAYLAGSGIAALLRRFQKIILFDIHGVYIDGDFEVEDLKEVPGTRKVIEGLKKKYRVAGFTNMSPEMFRFYFHKWNFGKVYHQVFHSGQYGVRKPSIEAFQAVLKDLGARPEQVIFVDDRQSNVEGARKAGLQAVQFKGPEQLVQELRKLNIKVS